MADHPQTVSQAKQQAYRLLAYRSQTAHELRTRLERSEYTPEVIGEVLRQLQAEGYADDRKVALDWARYRLQTRPRGRRLLAWELQRRGILPETIEEVLREIYAEFDELALATDAARRRLGTRELPRVPHDYRRLIRYLTGLGFSAETVAAAVGRVSDAPISFEISSENEVE